MLAVLSKLIYLLTFSPFHAEAGLLKAPEIDQHENENLPSGDKSRSTEGSGRSLIREPRILPAFSGHSFFRALGIDEDHKPTETEVSPHVVAFIGILLETLLTYAILQFSENQTIIFLVGYAEVLELIGVVIATWALFVDKDSELGKNLLKGVLGSMDSGLSVLLIALIAKIFYFFRPPPSQSPRIRSRSSVLLPRGLTDVEVAAKNSPWSPVLVVPRP